MGQLFIITINCSNVLQNLEGTNYVMLVDNTKMSIVYEIKEWIRWIFSLEGCFDLTYNKMIIHDLEDIRILSNFNTIDLKPCETSNCNHKKIHVLLSALNFYIPWNGTVVPKILLQKLSEIEHKLNSEKHEEICNKDTFKLEDTSFTSPESVKKDLESDSCDKVLNNSLNLNYTYEKHDKKCEDEMKLKKPNSNKKIKTFSAEELIKTDKNCIVNLGSKIGPKSYDTSSNVKTITDIKNSPQSDLDNDVLFNNKSSASEISKSNKNKNTSELKRAKYSKPFSLGEILANFRSESEKQTDTKQFDLSQNSPIIQTETTGDMESCNCESLMTKDLQVNYPTKKRKRTRTKKKKNNLLAHNFIGLEQENSEVFWNSKKVYSEAKPCHIRFNTDDNIVQHENLQICNKEAHEIFDDSKEPKNNGDKLECLTKEELLKIINDKKQAFYSSTPKNDLVKCDGGDLTSETTTQSQIDKNQNSTQNFSSEPDGNNTSCHLGALFQLKEKLKEKGPVVFERF